MKNITSIIPVVLNVLIAGIAIFMSIKVKFARTEEEAIKYARTILLYLILFLAIGFNTYFLFKDFMSSAPLDRASLFCILYRSFSLFFSILIWLLWPFLTGIRDFGKFQIHVAENQIAIAKKVCDECHQKNK